MNPEHPTVPSRRPRLPLPSVVTDVGELLLGFVYPACCQLCELRRARAAEGYVCAECRAEARPVAPPFCRRCGLPFEGEITSDFECTNCREQELHFEYARAALEARTVTLEVIHRFKYNQALWFEPFLADFLARAALPELAGQGWDGIVPVPLHPVKERERGYNQAERLARDLARRLALPVRTDLVQRVEPTRTQTRLTRAERAENVRRAFAPTPNARADGLSLIVLDDVFTTGATTNAVARILERLGAQRVCVWSVARGV